MNDQMLPKPEQIHPFVATEKDISSWYGSPREFKKYLLREFEPKIRVIITEVQRRQGGQLEPMLFILSRSAQSDQLQIVANQIGEIFNSSRMKKGISILLRVYIYYLFQRSQMAGQKVVASMLVSEAWFASKEAQDGVPYEIPDGYQVQHDPERFEVMNVMLDMPTTGASIAYKIERTDSGNISLSPFDMPGMENEDDDLDLEYGGTFAGLLRKAAGTYVPPDMKGQFKFPDSTNP